MAFFVEDKDASIRRLLSPRQVVDALPDDRVIDFWTVQTFLRRLVDNGYLRARKEGRANVYSPAVQPEKVVREVTDDLINRLFGGKKNVVTRSNPIHPKASQ